MSKFIAKTVDICFIAFAVLMMICLALSGGKIIFADNRAYLLALVLVVLCAAFVIFGSKILHFTKEKLFSPIAKASTFQLMAIIGIVTLITKLIFIFLFDCDANLHPDMQRYLAFANNIANDGKITDYVWYAYRHKRTAIYGLVLAPFAWLFGSDTQALTVGLTIGVSIVSILLFDILRKRTGNTVAFVGIMIYNLMPFGLFQTQLLVHETALLFFHILSFWLLLKAREKKFTLWIRILFFVLAALALSVGKSINPSGDVIAISMVIFTFIGVIREKITFKKLVRFACLILVFLVFFSVGKTALTKTVSTMIPPDDSYASISQKKVTYGWTIYLAFNPERYGVWNQEDYETYYAYEQIEDVDAAKAYQIDLIKNRLGEYVKDPLKLPVLFYNKFDILWGNLWMSFTYQQGNHIENFFYTGMSHLIYAGMYLASALCFMLTLSIALFSRKKRRYDDEAELTSPCIHFKMVILGITAALLFAEVTAKYTSHLHILLFVIGMYCLKDFYAMSTSIREKLFKHRV